MRKGSWKLFVLLVLFCSVESVPTTQTVQKTDRNFLRKVKEQLSSKIPFLRKRKMSDNDQLNKSCAKKDSPSTAAYVGAASLIGAAAGISAGTIFGQDYLQGVFFGLQKYQIVLSGSYFVFFIAAGIPGRLDQKIGM